MQNYQLSNNKKEVKHIKVSIIVPAYNVENYIEECLNSLVKQTLYEIEIIVVNDGSTDETGKIISFYASMDDRIVVINQSNSGLSVARNQGLLTAQGEYVLFVDSDDYLENNCVETLYRKTSQKTDIVLYGANIFTDLPDNDIYLQEKKNKIWERTTRLNENISGIDLFCAMLDERKFVSSVVIQLYKNSFLRKNKIRFADGYIHEDFAFSFQALVYAKNVICIADKLYNRRIRCDSTVTTYISYKNFKGRFKAYLDVLDVMSKLKIEEEKRKYYDMYADLLLDNVHAILKKCPYTERIKICFETDLRTQKLYEAMFMKDEIDNYVPYEKEKKYGYLELVR